MRVAGRFILSILVWSAAVAHVTPALSQTARQEPDLSFLFEYDRAYPLRAELGTGVEDSGGTAYKLTYRSTHEVSVPAVLVFPETTVGKKWPCIIVQHGLGQKKEDLRMLWRLLLRAGYAVFAMDAPYHGERANADANPVGNFRFPVRTRDGFIQAVVDLRRGVDYLQSRADIDGKRIGYFGVSMGAIIGAIFAGVDDRVQASVLMVGGANWELLIKGTSLPLIGRDDPTYAATIASVISILKPVDPLLWVGRISPRPVLMVNGDADTVVPVAANKALHDAAREPKEVYWYKGGHIPDGSQFLGVSLRVGSWLTKHLRGEASGK